MAQLSSYKEIVSKWESSKKIKFISFLFREALDSEKKYSYGNDFNHKKNLMSLQVIQSLFRTKMILTEDDLNSLYSKIKEFKNSNNFSYSSNWIYGGFLRLTEYSFSENQIPESIKENLEEILGSSESSHGYGYKEKVKLDEKIKSFLFSFENKNNKVSPSLFLGKDSFAEFANDLIENQNENEKNLWYRLMALCSKSNGSKPTNKFLLESSEIIKELGEEKFHVMTNAWFQFIIQHKEVNKIQTNIFEGKEFHFRVIEFIDALNIEYIKGFIWLSSKFYDHKKIIILSKLAERCFRKIAEKGQASTAIGNACLYTFSSLANLEGIVHLSKLKLLVKQTSTLNIIDKYINESANNLGITADEIEDLSVEDFGLKNHQISKEIDGFTYKLELTGIGKTKVKWLKDNGVEEKGIPQSIKNNSAEILKVLKEEQKYIEQTSSLQKERLDRMLRASRKFSIDYFKEKYINHGLLSFIIKNIIFIFSDESLSKQAIFVNQKWIDLSYNSVDIDKFKNVEIWHPVTSNADEVKEWRQFLLESQLQQPIKQAFREIYLLTEAELNTRTYSNRMASHILKQHQYISLAKNRNWNAKLLGAWDGGIENTAELSLPHFNLKVQFWVTALEIDGQFNGSGICNYVTTDQVRFLNSLTNELVDLIDVPPIAFSEAMRDVDLFVGVASVGNDPTWSDSGGLPTHRDYWQSYSFGDLSEIAKNRKEILKNFLPKLKIANIASIEDKFLKVKGKLRTYKIHIGSTNILMEPNDQYLCIVPDRKEKDSLKNVFLPFEGDTGLSIIISKAFLLAEDDKITDKTITSQILR